MRAHFDKTRKFQGNFNEWKHAIKTHVVRFEFVNFDNLKEVIEFILANSPDRIRIYPSEEAYCIKDGLES
jgi:hypothetical protein